MLKFNHIFCIVIVIAIVIISSTMVNGNVLVLGATGRTGKMVFEQLLKRDTKVTAIVRSPAKLSAEMKSSPLSTIIEKSLLDLSTEELAGYIDKHDSIISCLGHDGILAGIVGKPKWLVLDATKKVCDAIAHNKPTVPVKYILMTLNGLDCEEFDGKRDFVERNLLWLVKKAVHSPVDNEHAGTYLHKTIGKFHPHIHWSVVRPGTLIDSNEVSAYALTSSAKGTVIQSNGDVRIANVANFKCELATNPELWNEYIFKMPVILDSKNCKA